KKSVLHYVNAEATALQGKLGQADRETLDKYLTSIHDLEASLAKRTVSTSTYMAPATPPSDDPFLNTRLSGPSYVAHVRQWLDLVPLAFQCDVTRVVLIYIASHHAYFDFVGAPNVNYPDWHNDVEHGASAILSGSTPEDVRDRAQAYANG